MSDFSGRVVLITGAGKGIGKSYAEWFAARGAKVVVNNRSHPGVPSSAQAVADQICRSGGIAIADEHSVEDESGNHAMVETAIREFGRLDILICNAAISAERMPIESTPMERMRQVMAINFYSCVYSLQAALPGMIKQDYGRIVLTGSASGFYGQRGNAAYGASKTALIGLARCVAYDNRGRNIFINIVNPYARTEMAKAIDPKFSELLAPKKVAPVVGYLCSDACRSAGKIYAVGAGRVRAVAISDGPVSEVDDDNFDTVVPEVKPEPGLFTPTSSENSSLGLIPEITANR